MQRVRDERLDDKPWHRQFWPWFLIGLVSAAVLASLFTLYLAVTHPDPVIERGAAAVAPDGTPAPRFARSS